jgi:hypothetical protein
MSGAFDKVADYDVGGYEAFRQRAIDEGLSGNQKSGFPDTLRTGQSDVILADIDAKLPAFARPGARVLDIGIGCSDLSRAIVSRAIEADQHLCVIDSPEVLSEIGDGPRVDKIAGPFPACLARQKLRPFDAILAYSVVQYVFGEGNLSYFVDSALLLLEEVSGALLIGDIPNSSMRKRFFASRAGQLYHSEHYPGRAPPDFRFNTLEPRQIDDSIVLGILARARAAGFQAYVLPQGRHLPMANRREDILITRP